MARRHVEVSSNADVIDSRDVIARIEELEGWEEGVADAVERVRDCEAALNNCDDDTAEGERAKCAAELEEARKELADAERLYPEEEREELAALRELADQAEGYADDWHHGATLIRDSYFKTYAQQYADDIGAIDRNASWPLSCIDWDQAADELRSDYTAVEFDGVTYWVR